MAWITVSTTPRWRAEEEAYIDPASFVDRYIYIIDDETGRERDGKEID
jgi:hypothetical protein